MRWTQFDVDNARQRIKARGMEVINTIPPPPAFRSKYKNIKCTSFEGKRFDSKKEMKRYYELKILERAGFITDLELQKRFDFIINDQLICFYRADFSYKNKNKKIVVEDVKSAITKKLPVYQIKKKLMAALHSIKIIEI